MNHIIPTSVNLLFVLLTLIVLLYFFIIHSNNKRLIVIVISWTMLHSVLAYIDFYQNFEASPPRFGLVIIPTILAIIFVSTNSKFISWLRINRKTHISAFIHTVRLPVELFLWYLFTIQLVPERMTFEGINYDIIMGITAPIIGLLSLKRSLPTKVLLAWNIIGLALILFIFTNGILSAPLPFQQFAFNQPNVGMTFFPFILLPAIIVPIVIFMHVTDIILLIELKK